MAQRRPITTHPAFTPLVAGWFAALLGLATAVLPDAVIARLLAAGGLVAPGAMTSVERAIASLAAALLGGAAGFALARWAARRQGGDPRPVFAEFDNEPEPPEARPAIRRPLRVREELAEEGSAPPPSEAAARAETPLQPAAIAPEPDESFMILTPQPAHPPHADSDIEALLAQFDSAVEAFKAGSERTPDGRERASDPVRAFVARQTGRPAPSPLGGWMPDHQAELRAALDKLAESKRSG
jgi:hypothetical protein